MSDTFAIGHLKIENFRAVESFESDFSEDINCFVGINGTGKSTILEAIAILFSWFTARIRNSKGNGISLKDDDITKGKSFCTLEISLTNGISWTIHKQRSTSRKKIEGKSQFSEMTNFINTILIQNEDNPNSYSLPLFASYGVNRVVDETPGRLLKDHALSGLEVYNKDLNKQLNYRSFFRWFNEREMIEDKEFRYNRRNFKPDMQLMAVRSAIENILPGYSNLHINAHPRTFVIEKNGEEFLFDQLSDGEKSLIALVGDIARKFAMTHPYSEKAIEEQGIVVIDEIDLHLHPSWQRDVLPKMRSAFQSCQFVVSTHSPFVLTNINSSKGERIFLMKNRSFNSIESNIYGREITSIIQDILEMPSLRNVETQAHLRIVWDCLKKGDNSSQEYQNALEWLRENIDNSDVLFMNIALQERINAKQKEK